MRTYDEASILGVERMRQLLQSSLQHPSVVRLSQLAVAAAALVVISACGGAAGDVSTPSQSQSAAADEPEEGAEVSVDPSAEDESESTREHSLAVVKTSKKPIGFAAGVTGGAGGEVVRVKTAKELAYQLCRKTWDGCIDDEPRVIEIDSVIDLVADKPTLYAPGCTEWDVDRKKNPPVYPAACPHPYKKEVMLIVSQNEAHRCSGDPTLKTHSYKDATGLLVGSNKTIIGVGSKAGVKGLGFKLDKGVKNIIIRNLSITDVNYGEVFGGDAITIWGASGVWIDHNYFARVGRQMMVTGFGNVDKVTVSNNEFDGRTEYRCDGSHYWNFLLTAPTGSMTWVGNWIHDFSGRAPSLGGNAFYHFVNNLFERTPSNGHAFENGHGPDERLNSFIEGNYFKSVNAPVGGVAPFFGLWKQTAATRSQCNNALGRLCSGNIAEPMPQPDAMRQDSAVLAAAKKVKAGLVKPYSASSVEATVKANAGVGRI
jgi:pectate lyase